MVSVGGPASSSVVATATVRVPDQAASANSATSAAASAERSSAAGAAVTAQVSPAGTILGDLLAAANQFVRDEHIEPFRGYDLSAWNAGVNEGAYLDVGKYNDYVFEKAAGRMVENASAAGIALKKDEVVEQLKFANADIAALRDDDAALKAALGWAPGMDGSTLAELSPCDRAKVTDIYIAAKEKGLDTDVVQGLANRMGSATKMQRLGIQYAMAGDYVMNIDDAASPAEGVSDALSKIASDLYGEFGLDNMLINWLVASSARAEDERDPMLSFLLDVTGVSDPDRKAA